MRNLLISLVAINLVFGPRLLKGDLISNDLLSIQKGQSWLSKIVSYQFTLRSYSELTPQKYFEVTYREKGPEYYYHSSFHSDSPADQGIDVVNIAESWDGSTSMFLNQSTGTMLVGKQPYAFKPPWRLICGLFFPFRFVLIHLPKDTVETPQLKDVVTKLSDFISSSNTALTTETKNNEPFLCLTTDGGFDFLTKEQVTIKTHFSKINNFYPTIVETYDKNGKLKSSHTVEELKTYHVGNTTISIPFPTKLRSVYYDAKTGVMTNSVITEYTDVVFNSDDINDFQIDPSQARAIFDQEAKKVISIPR